VSQLLLLTPVGGGFLLLVPGGGALVRLMPGGRDGLQLMPGGRGFGGITIGGLDVCREKSHATSRVAGLNKAVYRWGGRVRL
jgi:hypothetical protein